MSSDDENEIKLTPAQRKRLLKEQLLPSKKLKQIVEPTGNNENEDEDSDQGIKQDTVALVEVAAKIRKLEENDPNAKQKKLKQKEDQLLNQMKLLQNKTLNNVVERAQGIKYTESMKTSWIPPHSILNKPKEYFDSLREKYKIDVNGTNIPPLIKRFADMKLPTPILEGLKAKGITKPTPIQVQGLPSILTGRDIVGISYTGSGKTIVFIIPLLMFALEEERKLHFESNEGPVGIILSPSRELAIQTYEVIQHFVHYLDMSKYEHINAVLCIGGEDRYKQLQEIRKGCHIIVATPGRLNDFAERKQVQFDSCKYLCLDEADRMLDAGFDEEVQKLLLHFNHQRQTVLFSATFPKQTINFVQNSLVDPLIINVGRAGAANLDVLQSFHLVDEYNKAKFVVTKCLNKTKPPCLIFCQSQQSVDLLYEYLTLKGIDAVASHGGISQEERNKAVSAFKNGEADVLIATDVAAKGLDFPVVHHVINYDIPPDIETYVHRIGRTGRRGQQGVASTLLTGAEIGDPKHPPSILLDIKHLLIEAKQTVPPILARCEDPTELLMLDSQNTNDMNKGCAFCGGLGHKAFNCPKLLELHKRNERKRDYLADSGY